MSTDNDRTEDNNFNNGIPEEIQTLEKTHPKLGRLMRRLYHWRILYGFLGFLLGLVKWLIELVIETHN